jgi:hypothetical protein
MSNSPSGLLVLDNEASDTAGSSGCARWRLDLDHSPRLSGHIPRVSLAELERAQVEDGDVKFYTDILIHYLERDHGADGLTPGGISWLRTHAVPVRRLVTQVVKKLLALSSWWPFAIEPGPILTSSQISSVEVRDNTVLGYHSYTVTWSGIASLFADGPDAHEFRDHGVGPANRRTDDEVAPFVAGSTDVLAVSWSSRHAQTLFPVLENLAERGISSLVVDLATETDQHFPSVSAPQIAVLPLPTDVFATVGSLPGSPVSEGQHGQALQVGACRIDLDRLAQLAARTVEQSTDCTQPSWAAVCRLERLLDSIFRAANPAVLLCSNDTSPVGVLAVGAADRAGADTVYVQHGAWVSGQVTGRAEHCRHIAVMGTRDIAVAQRWARRSDAQIHVVGQPRFDALAAIDRHGQRQYLRDLLSAAHGSEPELILVWACQPVSADRLGRQFDALIDGLLRAEADWGVVIAPHPAQTNAVFTPLLASAPDLPIAVAAPEVGARGCLGGADAAASASSTCGIEALLLNVPVLELTLAGSRTLGLAEQRAAWGCPNGIGIAIALDHIAARDISIEVPDTVRDAVCRSTGDSTDAAADVVAACLASQDGSRRSPSVSTTTFIARRRELT